MQQIEISKFKKVLNARVIELGVLVRRRDGIAIVPSAEELERRLHASEREIAMQNLEKESAKLREARAALRRIDEGSYGICQECDGPISAKRLAAVPAAALCIRCQEAVDCRCGAASLRPAFAMAA